MSGGATTIATARVARAAPDGYTLLLHNLQISANVSLYHNLPFDTEKDLTPHVVTVESPSFESAASQLMYGTMPEADTERSVRLFAA